MGCRSPGGGRTLNTGTRVSIEQGWRGTHKTQVQNRLQVPFRSTHAVPPLPVAAGAPTDR